MTKTPKHLLPLVKLPIAIFGMGISGTAAIRLLESRGWTYSCYDQNSENKNQRHFGCAEAKKHKLVIYSPGFDCTHPWLQIARKTGCVCLSEIDFASLLYKGTIIGITGTNGKTTLTLFLTQALKALGLPAVATGNNDHPLSLLAINSSVETIAVCEISSFQAEPLNYLKLDALLWTNFSEDHLERHHDLEHYFAAKWNLVKRLRRPLLIVGKSVREAGQVYGYAFPHATTFKVIDTNNEDDWPALKQSRFWTSPQRENFLLAHSYWDAQGWSKRVLENTLTFFTPPEHRLKKVAEVNGIAFWNDSKATNFASTLAALSTFKQPVIWIGGGKAKGGDIRSFANNIAPKVHAAFLIGETATILFEHIKKIHSSVFIVERLEAAIQNAFTYAKPGAVILLSPGFSSMDQFKDYAQRGETFEKIVLNLTHLPFTT